MRIIKIMCNELAQRETETFPVAPARALAIDVGSYSCDI